MAWDGFLLDAWSFLSITAAVVEAMDRRAKGIVEVKDADEAVGRAKQ